MNDGQSVPASAKDMRRLVAGQVGYAALGLGFNMVSLALSAAGRQPLHDGSAVIGLAAMAVYTASLALAARPFVTAYRLAMGAAVVVLGYGGVVVHLLRGPFSDYYLDPAVWLSAVAINTFGLVLNLRGVFRDGV